MINVLLNCKQRFCIVVCLVDSHGCYHAFKQAGTLFVGLQILGALLHVETSVCQCDDSITAVSSREFTHAENDRESRSTHNRF